MTVVLVDEVAYTDVRTNFECASHINGSITTTTPVVVLHWSTVHLHYTTSRWDCHCGVNHSVVEGDKERGNLEYRTWLATVADGIVYHLIIVAVLASGHIYDCFYVASLYFHKDGNTHFSVDLFQLINQGALGQILHTNVDCRYNINSILW